MNRDMMYDKSKYASMRYAENRPSVCPVEQADKCGCDDGYAINFAAWELRLYLDTHPWDREALAAYEKLCAENGTKCTYACHVGKAHGVPLHENHNHECDHGREHVWHWIDDPWPWELAANLKGGGC